MDRIDLILLGRGRAGEVVNLIHLSQIRQRVDNVVRHTGEVLVIQKVHDIAHATGLKIVDADDLMAIMNQPLAQMRADKTCAPCHHNPASVLARFL